MIPDNDSSIVYTIGEAIPDTVDDDAFRMTRTLLDRIVEAQDIALKDGIEANAVVVNGRKYGMLKNRPGLTPTVFGMSLETREDMPDNYDFIIQHREPELQTNYDRLISKTPQELAEWLRNVITECSRCPCNETPVLCEKPCKECLFDWLKAPAEEGKG